MRLHDVTIDGQRGLCAYFDSDMQMVDPSSATMAKVVFDDGRRVFYRVSKLGKSIRKYSPDQARDEFGRWTDEGGGTGGGEDAATDSPEYRAGLASAEETRLLNESAKGIKEVEKHLDEVIGKANPKAGWQHDDEEEESEPEWDNVDEDDKDKVRDKFIEKAQESSDYWEDASNSVDADDYLDEDAQHDDELKRFLEDASDAVGVKVELRPPEVKAPQFGDPDYDGARNTAEAESPEPYDWREAFEKGDYSALHTVNGTQVLDEAPKEQGLLIMEPDPNAPMAEQFMPARINEDDLGNMWEDAKEKALERARENALENDSYREAVSNRESELIIEAWNNLDDSEKLSLASDMDIYPSSSNAPSSGSVDYLEEPDEWQWTGDREDKDYQRTRALADVLVDRRAAEIFKERGLTMRTPSQVKETVWDEWKSSSTSPIGMALQVATAEELGGVHRFSASEVLDAKRAAKTAFGGADGYDHLKAYARAQWETTQFVMSKAGVDHVEVYRGLMLPKEIVANASREKLVIGHPDPSVRDYGEYEKLTDVSLFRNGAQSTSVDAKVANDWNGIGKVEPDAKRVVLRIRAPRTSVISIPVFGKNLKKEQEVVLAGTQGRWTWDAWVGRAPKASYAPIKAVRPMARPGQVIIDFGELDRGPHWMSALRGEKGAVAKYSPDQPRDDHGRWTDGGSSSSAPRREAWEWDVLSQSDKDQAFERWRESLSGAFVGDMRVQARRNLNIDDFVDPNDTDIVAARARASFSREWENAVARETERLLADEWDVLSADMKLIFTQDQPRVEPQDRPSEWDMRSAGRSVAKYSPDQPRDERGRWTDGGSDGPSEGDGTTEGPDRFDGVRNEAIIAQPSSHYPVLNQDGRDTHEKFSSIVGGQAVYTPERAELHEAIIAKQFDKEMKSRENPVFTMMGGGAASGKSTIDLGDIPKDIKIDPDEYRPDIPEYRELSAAGNKGAAGQVHEEVSTVANRVTRMAADLRVNTVLDGLGNSTIDKLTKKVDAFRARGYRAVAHYVTCDFDAALARIEWRYKEQGRYVNPDAARAGHSAVSKMFPDIVKSGLFDELTLWDTNNVTPGKRDAKKIAYAKGKEFTVLDRAAYQRFLDKAKL